MVDAVDIVTYTYECIPKREEERERERGGFYITLPLKA
jgi:hypothetical protein